MKIAIIHDDFSVFGGGEKMMFELAIELKADIITFSLNEEVSKILKQYEKKPRILTLKNKNDPINEELKRYYFSNLKLKGKYDFYIFSGHQSINAAKNHKPNLYYINYIPRFILPNKNKEGVYFEKTGFPIKDFLVKLSILKKKIMKKEIPKTWQERINHLAIKISTIKNPAVVNEIKKSNDKENLISNLNKVGEIITNSKNMQNKVKEYYKEESNKIYPFIDFKKINSLKSKDKENFWISINRIVPHKRIEMQIKAFSQMPEENLLIIGQKQVKNYYKDLLRIKPSNVKFLGMVSEDKKLELLRKCKGVIFTGYDEDFGLVPVEAMACGKPVIGPDEGGLRETIINGKTGILIENINSNKIVKAMRIINNSPKKFTIESKNRAKLFDKKIFVKKILKEIRKSTGKEIKVRKYHNKDKREVVNIINKNLNKKIDVQEFEWKYSGKSKNFVGISNKRIVGFLGNIQNRGIYEDKDCKFNAVTDLCLEKKFRGEDFIKKSIGIAPLQNKYVSYGFPKRFLLHNYKKLKFLDGVKQIKIFSSKKFRKIPTKIKLEELSRKNKEELNALWSRKKPEIKAGIIRDMNFIEWRFIKNPRRPKIFLLKEIGKTIGYFVELDRDKRYILDILILNGKESDGLRAVINYFTDSKKEVNILINDEKLENEFRRQNFECEGEIDLIYYDTVKKNKNLMLYVTYADTDFF